MAPRVQRDCCGVGYPSRYSLRTLRHCENNSFKLRDVDVSKVNGKEDFFRCIGLQMRKFQYHYRTPNGGHRVKTINIPHGVMLRECRVVILGTDCALCGKCFKCETDLNEHLASTHRTSTRNYKKIARGTRCIGTENPLCRIMPSSAYDHATTIVSEKSLGSKLQKKLRVTLRIGKEVVAKISVKRKHLKTNTVDICTQTEAASMASKLRVNDEDVHDIVASGIDPAVFGNSPYQYCDLTVDRVNSPNRYPGGNIVENKRTVSEVSVAGRCGDCILSPYDETCDACINKQNYTISPRVSSKGLLPELRFTRDASPETPWLSRGAAAANGDYSDKRTDSNPCTLRYGETYSNGFSEQSKSRLEARDESDAVPCVDVILERTVQSDLKMNEHLCYVKDKDVNANEIQREAGASERQAVPNTVQLIMPVILPIIVQENNENPSSTIKLTIEPASPQQQQRRQDQRTRHAFAEQRRNHLAGEKQEEEEHHRGDETGLVYDRTQGKREQQRELSAERIADNDDEIQEVLRIVRGRSISTEINHESPNRFEQEMLIKDAIRDMRRMEDQGWHLLERNCTDLTGKKRTTRTDGRHPDSNAENTAKRRRWITVQPNSRSNVVRSSPSMEMLEGCAKDDVARVQSYSGTMTVCAEDSLKENLVLRDRNAAIPLELLQRYGINYYNEPTEINNNMDGMQEAVKHFLCWRSNGMETRSNRPAVIDLVNDADE